jgi:RHS repeat-associated protein
VKLDPIRLVLRELERRETASETLNFLLNGLPAINWPTEPAPVIRTASETWTGGLTVQSNPAALSLAVHLGPGPQADAEPPSHPVFEPSTADARTDWSTAMSDDTGDDFSIPVSAPSPAMPAQVGNPSAGGGGSSAITNVAPVAAAQPQQAVSGGVAANPAAAADGGGAATAPKSAPAPSSPHTGAGPAPSRPETGTFSPPTFTAVANPFARGTASGGGASSRLSFGAELSDSSTGAVYVLDFNTGVTMLPGVTQHSFAGWSGDLRAQVIGAPVSSYSWDTSAAPDATDISGDHSYDLNLTWAADGGGTDTITLTTTFADSSTNVQSFTYTIDPATSPAWTTTPVTSYSTWQPVQTPDQMLNEATVAAAPYLTLGLDSGAVETSQTLPTYNPDVPALSLMYKSTTADSEPVFVAHYTMPVGEAVPATLTATLTLNGSAGPPVYYDTSAANPGDILQFALQADATALPTGRYLYQIDVADPGWSGEGTDPYAWSHTDSVDLVNRGNSAFGAGWWLSGLERVWAGSGVALVEYPDGSTVFHVNELGIGSNPPGDFTSFRFNTDLTFTETKPDGTQVNFNTAGYQTSVVDRNGNTTSYVYDGSNRLHTITDWHGLTTTLSYDTSTGVLSSITGPAGAVTHFESDAWDAGDLMGIQDAAGLGSVAYGYDTAHRMTFFGDAYSDYYYISSGPGGVAGEVDMDPDHSTRSLAPLVRMGWADGSSSGTASAPAPVILAATANAQFTDANSYPWWTQFDWAGFGSAVQTVSPLGENSLAYRDANDLPWLTADPLARRTRTFYDGLANPTKTVRADDTYTQATYNGFSEPLTVTDANGNTTTYVYDSSTGDNTSITDANGHTTTQTFFSGGYLHTVTDPLSHTTTYGYDSRDRVTSVTDALGHETDYGYNTASDQTSVSDALGHTSTATYDAMNHPLTTTDALGHTTTFTYDAAGNLYSLEDPDLNTTYYGYNAFNQVVQEIDPLGHTTSYTYDLNGNLLDATDRDGRTRGFAYDPDNRRVAEGWWDGGAWTNALYYTYDAAGELKQAYDNNSYYSYDYDALGRETDEFGYFGPLSVSLYYTYDANGNVLSVSDGGGAEVDYTYSPTNQLSQITTTGLSSTSPGILFTYDHADRLTDVQRWDAYAIDPAETAYTYDDANRLTDIHDTSATTTADFAYGYDAGDRITSYTGPDGSLTYTYDSTDQLTGVSGSHSESYSYDANGNRTMSGYATDTGNRLTSDGTYTYTYDDEGNLIAKSKSGEYWTYSYDLRNRLTEATERTSSGGSVVYDATYTYDLFDRRIGVDDNGTQTWTQYDGTNAWADFDGSGAVATHYVNGRGMDERYGRADASGNVAWYLTDNVNSVRQIVTTSGTVLYAAAYSAFGVIRSASGTGGDRFKFTGREWDAGTGQCYYRARYYGAGVGRFAVEDQGGLAMGDANLNRYVNNAPTVADDPTGFAGIDRGEVKGRGAGDDPNSPIERGHPFNPFNPVPARPFVPVLRPDPGEAKDDTKPDPAFRPSNAEDNLGSGFPDRSIIVQRRVKAYSDANFGLGEVKGPGQGGRGWAQIIAGEAK